MKRFNTTLVILLLFIIGNAQSEIDNIKEHNESDLDSIEKILRNRDKTDLLELHALLERSKSLDYQIGVAKFNTLLGDYFSIINADDDAEKFYLDGLEAARKCNNETKLEILALGNLSTFYSSAIELDKAYDFTIQQLHKAEECGDSSD